MMNVEMAVATRAIAIVLVEVWIYSFHDMGVSELEEDCSTISIQALIVACRARNDYSPFRLQCYRKELSSIGLHDLNSNIL